MNNFYIYGEDFYETLVELGESVEFQTEPKVSQYASIIASEIKNTADGVYQYNGAMTFDDRVQQKTLAGKYFIRSSNPEIKNILCAVVPDNTTPKVASVRSVECNCTVDIISHYEKSLFPDKFGIYAETPVYIAQDVDVFWSVTLSKIEEQQQGGVVQTVSNMIIPASFKLSEQNIIIKKEFEFDEDAKENRYSEVKYKINSIDTSMMNVVGDNFYGILKCMLTLDDR